MNKGIKKTRTVSDRITGRRAEHKLGCAECGGKPQNSAFCFERT